MTFSEQWRVVNVMVLGRWPSILCLDFETHVFFNVLRSESLVPVLFMVWVFIVFIFCSYVVFHSSNVLVLSPLFIIGTLCSLCLLVKFFLIFFLSLLVNPLSYFLFYFIPSFILCVLCLVLLPLSCLAWLVSAVYAFPTLPSLVISVHWASVFLSSLLQCLFIILCLFSWSTFSLDSFHFVFCCWRYPITITAVCHVFTIICVKKRKHLYTLYFKSPHKLWLMTAIMNFSVGAAVLQLLATNQLLLLFSGLLSCFSGSTCKRV